jgi:hypothetical protein
VRVCVCVCVCVCAVHLSIPWTCVGWSLLRSMGFVLLACSQLQNLAGGYFKFIITRVAMQVIDRKPAMSAQHLGLQMELGIVVALGVYVCACMCVYQSGSAKNLI